MKRNYKLVQEVGYLELHVRSQLIKETRNPEFYTHSGLKVKGTLKFNFDNQDKIESIDNWNNKLLSIFKKEFKIPRYVRVHAHKGTIIVYDSRALDMWSVLGSGVPNNKVKYYNGEGTIDIIVDVITKFSKIENIIPQYPETPEGVERVEMLEEFYQEYTS